MRKAIGLALLLAMASFGCGGGKFSGAGQNFVAVVEFAQWPPLPAGVIGYNLYMAERPDGKFEKVNDQPISGGRMVIPNLESGQDYYFKMSSVGKSGQEGRQGGAFKRKAGPLQAGQTRPQ
jgi:hypothetical protein